MAITAPVIQKIVADEDDFGHEMRVGAAIRALPGFEVQHGGTYTDRVTAKQRQFDFRCSLRKGGLPAMVLTIPAEGCTGKERWTPTSAVTRLVLAVECKNLNPSFPIVICGTSRQDEEAFQDLIVSVDSDASVQRDDQRVVRPCSMRAAGKQSFFRPGDFVGKSLLRLKPKTSGSSVPVAGPDSDIYEKWAQALSSAVDLVDEAVDCARDGQSVWSAVLPVVVVSDESLWKVVYDCAGKASIPEQVDHCDFYVGYRTPSMPHKFMLSHIQFFTLSGFGAFLSSMASNETAWERLFDPGLLRFGSG